MIHPKFNSKIKPPKNIGPKPKKEKKRSKAQDFKIVHVLFGYCQYPGYHLPSPNEAKGEGMSKIYREILGQINSSDVFKNESYHFVLGEDNSNFLIENGVKKDHVILVHKKEIINDGNVSNFNKTFLLEQSAKTFPNDEILFLDYDCSLLKEFNREEIYKLFEKNKMPIQGPPICYRRKRLRGLNNISVRSGLQSCLLFLRDTKIVHKWFKRHLTTLYHTTNDEASLRWTLEEMYGQMSLDDFYRFDCVAIRTGRRTKSESYNKNNYKNAFFKHR